MAYPAMQVFEARLESLPVVLPCHAVHARRGFPLQREVGGPQFVDVDMVQKRGEPLFLLQPRGLPYAVEAVGRAFPARCPERAALIRVLLGPALGSTGSSAGRPASFIGFTATMAGPDFSRPCVIGFGSSPCRGGPSARADGQA